MYWGEKATSLLRCLITCLNILKNTLAKIQRICPGWQILKHTIKSISWLTENTFLIHAVLFLLKYLCSYHSTQDKLSSAHLQKDDTRGLWIQRHWNDTFTSSLLRSSAGFRRPYLFSLLISLPSTSHSSFWHRSWYGCAVNWTGELIKLLVFKLHSFLNPVYMQPGTSTKG